jgi:3,5-epimerase/4-reductase
MILLIYGHNGWIGQQFLELLRDKDIKIILGKARCDNYQEVEKEILENNPTNIISFIGRTHGINNMQSIYNNNYNYTTIDYLEQKGKLYENIKDNLFSPLILVLLANKYNCHLTYLGTGCIFKYEEDKFEEEKDGFREEDLPNFFGSSYSIVKGFTDRIMNISSNVLNLRIRMPITNINHPRNFITKIINYEKICSVKNSMSVLPDLLPILIDMVEKKISGTFNFTNPGLISHNEILEMYREIVDPNFTWNNFSIEEQSKILAADRSNNYLDTSKLESLYNIPNIKESIRNILLNYI